jgi:hypothetical protein
MSLDPHYWLHLASAQLVASRRDDAGRSWERARRMNIESMLLTPAERRELEELNRELAPAGAAEDSTP